MPARNMKLRTRAWGQLCLSIGIEFYAPRATNTNKNIHNIHIQRIHRHSHTLSTHNTITHSHTHAVTAAVAALDDITLPGGAAEGASAAYTRKGIQF